MFLDRVNFIDGSGDQRTGNVPTELEGADYIETSQNNADWTTENGKKIDIEIDVTEGGIVYLFIDTVEINSTRSGSRIPGSVPFHWMNPNEWDGNIFYDTGASFSSLGALDVGDPGPGDRQFYIYGVGPLEGGTYHIREQDVDASYLGIAALIVPEPSALRVFGIDADC